jgi:hypothetical protein
MNDTKPSIRRFHFVRSEDVSGVSGTGIVAEGVEFTDGSIVVRWLSHTASFGTFSNLKTFLAVHGHNGAGTVEWVDPDPSEDKDESKRTKKTTRKSGS